MHYSAVFARRAVNRALQNHFETSLSLSKSASLTIILALSAYGIYPKAHADEVPFDLPAAINTAMGGAVYAKVADIDGDTPANDPDIVAIARYDRKVRWFENSNGDGSSWVEHIIDDITPNTVRLFSVDVGDLDNDTDTDVVVSLTNTAGNDEIVWYENTNGNGSSWTRHTITSMANGPTPNSVSIAKIDDDDDFDVAAAFLDSGNIVWYENPHGAVVPPASWTERTIQSGQTQPRFVLVTDLDGDGNPDVLSAATDGYSGNVRWHERTATDGSTWDHRLIGNGTAVALTVADINGGNPDIIAALRFSNTITWFANPNSDSANWSATTIATTTQEVRSVAAADVDGDGDRDVFAASFADDEISWHDNTAGNGSAWTERIISNNADGSASIAVSDIDGDGAIDAVSASYNDDKIAWYHNRRLQPGVIITDTSGAPLTQALTVTEVVGTGHTAQFRVFLNAAPSATNTVEIPVASLDTGEGVTDITTLSFDENNWNIPKTVTLTGVDDAIDDGDVAYAIELGAVISGDLDYAGIDPDNINATTTDNDSAGIVVSSISGMTSEAGTTANFNVVLESEPVADIVIAITSLNLTEGSVDKSNLTFTPNDWNTAQTVTVTGVDDAIDDGDSLYTIQVGPVSSGTDPQYPLLDPNDVEVTNQDDDSIGITVGAIDGMTTEAGASVTFTVVLDSEPSADVMIAVTSLDTNEGDVDQNSLNFTPGNWNIMQTVTVTGINDDIDDGDASYTIQLGPVTSDDNGYQVLDPADVNIVNEDDDNAGVKVSAISGSTSEDGDSATFTVVLNSEPSSAVTIEMASSQVDEGTVAPDMLNFNATNWNVAQTVTVTGVDDTVIDRDILYTIQLNPINANGTEYDGIDPDDVEVTNLDNEQLPNDIFDSNFEDN